MTPLGRRAGATAATVACLVAGACAPGLQVGPPLPDPGTAARKAAEFPVERRPALLRFEWEYADERGNVEGDGAGRANPPDSLRVDLFTSGDVSLAAALTSGRLSTSGQIENVELPSAPFLYAMAGLFRPAEDGPEAAFETSRGLLLRYRTNGGLRREYLIDDGRLLRLEDRREGRLLRRVTVEWDSGGAWPVSAEYRSTVTPRRVRWQVRDVDLRSQPFDSDIYDLPRQTATERSGPLPPARLASGPRWLRVQLLGGRRSAGARADGGRSADPERDVAVRPGGRVHDAAHRGDDGSPRGSARR